MIEKINVSYMGVCRLNKGTAVYIDIYLRYEKI